MDLKAEMIYRLLTAISLEGRDRLEFIPPNYVPSTALCASHKVSPRLIFRPPVEVDMVSPILQKKSKVEETDN